MLSCTQALVSLPSHRLTIQIRSLEKGLFKNDVNYSVLVSCYVHADETLLSGLDFVLWPCCRDSIVPQWLEGHGSPTYHAFGRAAFPAGARVRRHTQDFDFR